MEETASAGWNPKFPAGCINVQRKGRVDAMAIDILSAFTNNPPPIDEILPGFVSGTVGVLSGPGASSKSMWALQAGVAIAGGPDLLHLGIKQKGIVHYIAAEDPEEIIVRRLHALGGRITSEYQRILAKMLVISPLMGLRLDIMNANHVQQIIDNTAGSRLVIIDTLNRVHALEENSNGDMGQLTAQLEYIARLTGAAVLHLHHVSKSAARLGDDDQHSARGASALSDNARWAAGLRTMSEKEAEKRGVNVAQKNQYVRWGVLKCNYTVAPFGRWYERREGGILVPTDLPETPPSQIKKGRREEA
ncbi:MAG: helicase RepA family protein [Rectinemataceae bacterium]|nr:helicase RepA family protein [Rectinemataceae bacterium]